MSVRNKFLILLSVLLAIAGLYYVFSTPGGNDLVLVGTVDSNQIVVSPQVSGRIAKLLVEEGTPVRQGDLIAELDPAELEAQERAAAATIASLRSRLARPIPPAPQGSTSSDVTNAGSPAIRVLNWHGQKPC
jgi:multidrug resistance efflux pump